MVFNLSFGWSRSFAEVEKLQTVCDVFSWLHQICSNPHQSCKHNWPLDHNDDDSYVWQLIVKPFVPKFQFCLLIAKSLSHFSKFIQVIQFTIVIPFTLFTHPTQFSQFTHVVPFIRFTHPTQFTKYTKVIQFTQFNQLTKFCQFTYFIQFTKFIKFSEIINPIHQIHLI